ncbi:MAG: hypothetical protein EXQ86_08160 [Rhodospirillales bacterium]|nr:hypothetical protein [Rhodospirillales bacterium]
MGGAGDVPGSALTEQCALLLDTEDVVKRPPTVWLERLRGRIKAPDEALQDAVAALCEAISQATIAVNALEARHRRKQAKNIIRLSVPGYSARFIARLEVLAKARIAAGRTEWLSYARPTPAPAVGRLAAEAFEALGRAGVLYTGAQGPVAAGALRQAHPDVRDEDIDAALDLLNRARRAALAFDEAILGDGRAAASAADRLHKKFPELAREFCTRLIAEAQYLMR